MRFALIASLLIATAATAQEFTTLKGHGGPVMDVKIHPQTGQVATASFDNAVGLWSGRTPTWLDGHEAAVNRVLFLDDTHIVSASDDFDLLLWDKTQNTHTRLEGHKGKVIALALSPDGQTIASASWDGTIGLWPRDTLSPTFLKGHTSPVNDVAFAPDGTLYSASADGTIRLWSDDSARILINQGFGINRLSFAPKGTWLAYGAVDGVTRILHPDTGDILYDFSLDRRPILSLAQHAGTHTLAVGDGQGYIMIIDTKTWRITRDFRAMRQGPVWALAFSPDGTHIYAGGIEDIAYAWPVALLDTYDPAGGETRSFLRDAETMSNGERQFMRKCSICHALSPPPSRKAGPSLHNLFGRRAGTVDGYSYSKVLTGSDIIWSDDSIDALFDLGPDHYIPGSKMPMQRITHPDDRRDLISFLRQATGPREDK